MRLPPPERTFQLELGLAPADPFQLYARAGAVSDPTDPAYGRHLNRAALELETAPPSREREALEHWLTGAGMEMVALKGADGLRLRVRATIAQAVALLGEGAVRRLLEPDRDAPRPATSILPRRWAGYVHTLHAYPDGDPRWLEPCVLEGGLPTGDPRGIAEPPPASVPATRQGATPSEIREGYRFPAGLSGQGETIALMALGGVPALEDLYRFWTAFDLPPPELALVRVGPMGARARDPLFRLETTMALEWMGAMAPAARLVVYLIDPGYVADPWAAFLEAVLSDTQNAPTIAVTTWSAPERQYYRVHGRDRIASLLDLAALAGITVVAASGDWGAYDGFPQRRFKGAAVCDAPWPHGVFPACEERVLAVGGTMVSRNPWLEQAWSAPLSRELAAAVGVDRLAGGGGFSEHVPIPAWQRPVLAEHYPRGQGAPAVMPYGRGYPDVALMAWGGPAGTDPLEAESGGSAYQCYVDGRWREDGGGTSLAAPIWACIVACINERRRARDLPRLGCAAPLLYAIGQTAAPPFRQVTGATDVWLKAVLETGDVAPVPIPGYQAVPGWNPAVGLGVPDLEALIQAMERFVAPGGSKAGPGTT